MSTVQSTAELITQDERAAAEFGEAESRDDSDRMNACHDAIVALYRELRSRDDGEGQLLRLLGSSDASVRLRAGTHALDFAPEFGAPVLEELARGGGIGGFEAQVTLDEWRGGRLKFP